MISLKDLTHATEPGSTPIADSVKTSLANALAVVPADKKGAALAYVDQTGTVHGVVALNLDGHWTLWANADYHVAEKDFDGTAGVRFTW